MAPSASRNNFRAHANTALEMWGCTHGCSNNLINFEALQMCGILQGIVCFQIWVDTYMLKPSDTASYAAIKHIDFTY